MCCMSASMTTQALCFKESSKGKENETKTGSRYADMV